MRTEKSRKLRHTPKIKYDVSQTIEGQALLPADLLKRHLAGTLPDIGKNPEWTYDEDGKQISEDLSHLELHELHDLAAKMRQEYDKRAAELKEQTAEEYRQQIIDEYKKSHEENQQVKPIPPASDPTTAVI